MQQLKKDLVDLTGKRIEVMNSCGIAQMVLSQTSPGLEGVADQSKAPDLATRWNDHLKEGIAKHKDRLRGFACLPMIDPAAATKELIRSVEDLGFLGALINGYTRDAQGVPIYYDGPEYHEFWHTVEKLDVPI